jgi:hypothetical protein
MLICYVSIAHYDIVIYGVTTTSNKNACDIVIIKFSLNDCTTFGYYFMM